MCVQSAHRRAGWLISSVQGNDTAAPTALRLREFCGRPAPTSVLRTAHTSANEAGAWLGFGVYSTLWGPDIAQRCAGIHVPRLLTLRLMTRSVSEAMATMRVCAAERGSSTSGAARQRPHTDTTSVHSP